jgi:hypothetical protein
MASLTLNTTEKSSFLRNVMRADAVFGIISGLFAIIDAGYIAEFLGAGDSFLYMALGVLLLIHSAALLYFSRSAEVPRWFVWVAIVEDVLWIDASLFLVFTGMFGLSEAGRWALFIVSDAVLAFAILKYAGLRRMR